MRRNIIESTVLVLNIFIFCAIIVLRIDTHYPKVLIQNEIKPYVAQMQQTIANILGVTERDVSIKATTTETMGFVGRQEGLIAYASCLLQKMGSDSIAIKLLN